jgi:hypothetical protein
MKNHIKALFFDSDENSSFGGLLTINIASYEKRVSEEVKKYYFTEGNIQPSAEVLAADLGDLANLDSAYTYLTPSRVISNYNTIELTNQGEALWNPALYNGVYQEALAAASNTNYLPIDLAGPTGENPNGSTSLSNLAAAGFTIAPRDRGGTLSIGIKVDRGDSEYKNSRDLLGLGTKFRYENLFDFELTEIPDENKEAVANTIIVSVAELLIGGISGFLFDKSSVSISSFDLSSPQTTISTELPVADLPIQIKSLALSRSPNVRKNWLDISFDPISNSSTTAMMQFNYLEIYEAQYLNNYSLGMKSPVFEKLTRQVLMELKNIGGSIICRFEKYVNSDVIPDAKRDLKLVLADQYFILTSDKALQVNISAPKKLPNLSSFGTQIMQHLQLEEGLLFATDYDSPEYDLPEYV